MLVREIAVFKKLVVRPIEKVYLVTYRLTNSGGLRCRIKTNLQRIVKVLFCQSLMALSQEPKIVQTKLKST